MSSQSNTEKMQLCLDFIDQRLETTAEQTIHIAEMIIEDIRSLTEGYQDALKEGTLKEHSELVRNTQMNWVNQLHDIILEQTNRDLNGQVIMALKQFVDKLNEKQFKHYQFDLPSAVASQQHSNEHEYLSQEEIDILMGQQNLFEEKTTHQFIQLVNSENDKLSSSAVLYLNWVKLRPTPTHDFSYKTQLNSQ